MRSVIVTILYFTLSTVCVLGPAAADGSYVPLAVGNTWTYSIDNIRHGHRTGYLKVTGAELVGEQLRYDILSDNQYRPGDNRTFGFAWMDTGWCISSMEGTIVDPPLLLMKTLVHTGDTWTSNDGDGDTYFLVISDNATVAVPASTYTGCVKVQQTWQGNTTDKDIFWYKAGVGMVQTYSYENGNFNTPLETRKLQSYTLRPELTIAGAKLQPNDTPVSVAATAVTQASADSFYIEARDRIAGIRVQKTSHGLSIGSLASVAGDAKTNSDGERYIQASVASSSGLASVSPLGMTNKTLSGANWKVSGTAGQIGVTGGAGLNNVGLLVRTTGACTRIDNHTFTIDDGSGVNIRCETPATILVNPAWQHVAVTGISSIYKSGATYERLLRVTSVNPVTSDTPTGITGRWEMTDTLGVYGMLLVQQGSTISGSVLGWTVLTGEMSGGVFTGTCFNAQYQMTIAIGLTLSGSTLCGTLTNASSGVFFPVCFSRVSPDPVSPYIGRPKVLSATCNGIFIDITWDRPVWGWDYDIIDDYGRSLRISGLSRSYDAATHTYQIALSPSTPWVAGAHYTIYLEEKSTPEVDWHDPYGAAAWDNPADCYRFTYTRP